MGDFTTKKLRSPLAAFLYLVPLCILLLGHRLLGLSDALLVEPLPGDREAAEYNFAIVLAFYLGIACFVHHLATRDRTSPAWVAFRLVALSMLVVAALASL